MDSAKKAALWLGVLAVVTGCSRGPCREAAVDAEGNPYYHACFNTSALSEASGMVKSQTHADVLWMHNDSGSAPELFAVRPDGEVVGTLSVLGAGAVDWESIAMDDASRLWIADIGDNSNVRDDLMLYRVSEPNPTDESVSVELSLHLDYSDRPSPVPQDERNWDSEAIFFAQGSLYVLTKHRADLMTTLYRVPQGQSGDSVIAEKISSFDVGGNPDRYGGQVTGADATPDGTRIAVLTYHALWIFERPTDSDDYLSQPIKQISFDQDVTGQCEAVAWNDDGIWFSNEGGQLFRLGAPMAETCTSFPGDGCG